MQPGLPTTQPQLKVKGLTQGGSPTATELTEQANLISSSLPNTGSRSAGPLDTGSCRLHSQNPQLQSQSRRPHSQSLRSWIEPEPAKLSKSEEKLSRDGLEIGCSKKKG